MENTTTKHLDAKVANATKTVFNIMRELNDAEYNDNVDKARLIYAIREEFKRYVAVDDAIFSKVANEFNEG